MIRTVLFDLDNTLLDFNRAERRALTLTLRELGIEPTEEIMGRYSELNLAQWKLLELGKLTRDQVKVRRYRLLFQELGVAHPAEDATRRYEGHLAEGLFLMEGAEALLQALIPRYRLYVVTNGTALVQQKRLQGAGLGAYFQGYFISEAIGFDKPRKEFFDLCFSVIPDFGPEETVIVGDSLSSDIQGGKNAGIRTIWFHPQAGEENSGTKSGAAENGGAERGAAEALEPVPDHTVRSLREIPSLLETL